MELAPIFKNEFKSHQIMYEQWWKVFSTGNEAP
jgi:hypothetical protein